MCACFLAPFMNRGHRAECRRVVWYFSAIALDTLNRNFDCTQVGVVEDGTQQRLVVFQICELETEISCTHILGASWTHQLFVGLRIETAARCLH